MPNKQQNAPRGRKPVARRRPKSVNSGSVLPNRRRVSAAAASSSIMGTAPMAARSFHDGKITVSKREYINDLSGAVDYSWDSYQINPGMRDLFPWLSAIATRYESYKFKKLNFEYVPRVATSMSGTVILSTDFDANDPGPDTKAEQLTYDGTVCGPVWAGCKYSCTKANMQKFAEKYTRAGILTDSDLKTTDVGVFYAAVVGCYNPVGTEYSGVLGELWVEYEVELSTPQLEEAGRAAKYEALAGVSTAAPFGEAIGLVTGTHATGCRAEVAYDGSLYKLKFIDAFEGLVHVYQAATAVGNLIYDSTHSNVKSASSAGTTNNTTCAATNAVFKVKADPGQMFYAIWSALTNPTATRISLVDAPYAAF